MNKDSKYQVEVEDPDDIRPILIVPYMWIGDFVRGHSVVRVLKQRWPNRPIDLLTTSLCAPLVDYMPGVRSGIAWDLPRSRLAVAKQWGLAAQLRAGGYGTALILPRTWKSAIAPALAGIPERVGFVGEVRFGLINRWRWGEKALPRFIDQNAPLALPAGAPLHAAAALGPPPMGVVGPPGPYHWAPLSGLAATVQTKTVVPCQPCHRPVCTMNDHRCMRDIPAADVVAIAERVLTEAGAQLAH